MTDGRAPRTRRLIVAAAIVGLAFLVTLARVLAGERSPWVLSSLLAFGVVLLLLGQRLWVQTRRGP